MGRLRDLLRGRRQPPPDKAAEKRALDRWDNEGGAEPLDDEDSPESPGGPA